MLKLLRESGNQIWKHIKQVSHPAIFPEMRVGKTLPVFRYVKSEYSRVLLVAPIGVYPSWVKWFESVNYIPFYLLNRAQKLKAINQVNDPSWSGWFLYNKESCEYYKEVAFMQWDCVILDESRFIANPKTAASKFFVRYFRDVNKRIIITGTPAPEHYLEYIQQLNFLDRSLLKMNYWEFRAKYCRRYGSNWWVMPEGKRRIDSALKKCAFYVSRNDIRPEKIEEKIYSTIEIDLPDTWKETYRKVEEELILQLPDSDEEISTLFSIVKFHWLRKICAGILIKDSYSTKKICALIDRIFPLRQAIIWANYREEIDFIYTNLSMFFPDKKVEYLNARKTKKAREKIIADFQKGNINYLIAHPFCSRFGNDFSTSRHEFIYSSPLGLETRLQSEDRCISINRSDPVFICDLIFKGTIEQDILTGLRKKESRQQLQKRIYNGILQRSKTE